MNVIPDLTRNPNMDWIPASAGMTIEPEKGHFKG